MQPSLSILIATRVGRPQPVFLVTASSAYLDVKLRAQRVRVVPISWGKTTECRKYLQREPSVR